MIDARDQRHTEIAGLDEDPGTRPNSIVGWVLVRWGMPDIMAGKKKQMVHNKAVDCC